MNPLVSITPSASVRGLEVLKCGAVKPVLAFLGIPFAEPPVGKLRFCPPKSNKWWTGEREAKKFGPICPQNIETTRQIYSPYVIDDDCLNEDCLYLNIWTPETHPNELLPVMVWFYGGGFVGGLSNYFDGTAFASRHDVVFVSFNYRVGAFGFMCTGDGHIQGNMGLLDQVEALKWVQKHISAFGGNPDNVTVFGESAGAISIALHLLSPMSKGLFRRAILQSGSSCFPSAAWAAKDAAKYCFKRAHQWSGIEMPSGKELVEFLADKPAMEIVEKMGLGFNPVVDLVFVNSVPVGLYESGRHHDVDVLLGFNTDEGFSFIDRLLPTKRLPSLDLAISVAKDIVYKSFFRGLPNRKEIYQLILREFLDGVQDGQLLYERLVEIYGKVLFILPALTQADYHSKKAKTYVYKFAQRPGYSGLPSWVVADHGQEIPFVFGEPFLERFPDIWTDEERKLSSAILTYWSNFAKFGNPNGPSLPAWPEYTVKDKQCMVLCDQLKSSSIERNLQKHLTLWKETIIPLASSKSKL